MRYSGCAVARRETVRSEHRLGGGVHAADRQGEDTLECQVAEERRAPPLPRPRLDTQPPVQQHVACFELEDDRRRPERQSRDIEKTSHRAEHDAVTPVHVRVEPLRQLRVGLDIASHETDADLPWDRAGLTAGELELDHLDDGEDLPPEGCASAIADL